MASSTSLPAAAQLDLEPGHQSSCACCPNTKLTPPRALKVYCTLLTTLWRFLVSLFGGGISRLKLESGGEVQIQKAMVEKAMMDMDVLLSQMESSRTGLKTSKAKELLSRHGPNLLPGQHGRKWAKILWDASWHPFNLILLTLAIISGVTSEMATFTLMCAMIVLSVGLRFQQEWKTSREASKLALMVQAQTIVVRCDDVGRSTEMQVNQSEVVPGDIVVLGMGDLLPGDVRIITSKDLFVSQSSLTGESIPVEKSMDITSSQEKSLLELRNICFLGTSVVAGSGTGLVLSTGGKTYIGSVAAMLNRNTPTNAFQNGVRRVSFLLVCFMLVMVPIVIVISGLSTHSWSGSFLFGISVAVGLTPEMLPMIVNANLARGALEMARKKCIVKRVDAVQNMGAMDILCTDKTGTLTIDNVVMQHYSDHRGVPQPQILEYALLNALFHTGLQNPLDRAILSFGEGPISERIDVQKWSMVDEIQFDFERRRLSVILHHLEEASDPQKKQYLLVTKGALEEMLSICACIQDGDNVIPMTSDLHDLLLKIGQDFNSEGFRVLVVATKYLSQNECRNATVKTSIESKMLFQGFLTFSDPPKESAKDAIHSLRQSGVEIKVLTGDNASIAVKVCRELGIPAHHVVTGSELANYDLAQFRETVKKATVLAKLTPFQKLEVIQTLKIGSHTVGFLGDGINDALGLKGADVGISVDSASSVAKDAAEIILLQKDLNVLAAGVLCGRITHGNTIKYIKMAASSNFGNVFSILVASAWLPFNPMRPIQILTQNLLYDISQVSIPWDKMDKGYTDVPRQWSAKGIAKFMVCMGPVSSIFDIVTFSLMWWYYGVQTVAHQSTLQTAWFVEGLLSQTLVIHTLRTAKIPFLQERASNVVIIVTSLVVVVGICIPFTPLGKVEKMVHLPASYFGFLCAILLSYCCLAQLAKFVYIKIFKTWL